MSKCLVGQLLSEKAANPFAIMEVMKKAWKSKCGLEAREWSNNLFLFRFKDETELKWVIKSQPWHFEGHLFLIRLLEEKEQPSKILLTEAQLWARIYDAPVSCMNLPTAQAIAKKLGNLISVDSSLDLFGKFIRVKVGVDVTRPLKRGVNVLVGGEKLWLPVKYEALPTYCYNCGLLGHTFKYCESINRLEDVDPLDLPFGPLIKASPLKKTRPVPARIESSKPSLNSLHQQIKTPTPSADSTTSRTPTILKSPPCRKSLTLDIASTNPSPQPNKEPTKKANLITTVTNPPTDLLSSMDLDSLPKFPNFHPSPPSNSQLICNSVPKQPPCSLQSKSGRKKDWKRLARVRSCAPYVSPNRKPKTKRSLSPNHNSTSKPSPNVKRPKLHPSHPADLPTAVAACLQPRRPQ